MSVITARAFRIATFEGLLAVAKLFYLNFASNISADLGIAIVLSYYLWKNKTGIRKYVVFSGPCDVMYVKNKFATSRHTLKFIVSRMIQADLNSIAELRVGRLGD